MTLNRPVTEMTGLKKLQLPVQIKSQNLLTTFGLTFLLHGKS